MQHKLKFQFARCIAESYVVLTARQAGKSAKMLCRCVKSPMVLCLNSVQPLAGVLLPTTSTNNNSNNSHNNNSNNSSDNVIVVVTSLARNIPLAASTSTAHIQLKARLLVDVCLKKCSQMLQGLGLYPMCKVSSKRVLQICKTMSILVWSKSAAT